MDKCTEMCWAVVKLMPTWRKKCFQCFSPVSHVMHFQVVLFVQVYFQSNQWSPFSLLLRGISRHLGYTKWRALKVFTMLSNTDCLCQYILCRKYKQKDSQTFFKSLIKSTENRQNTLLMCWATQQKFSFYLKKEIIQEAFNLVSKDKIFYYNIFCQNFVLPFH